MAIILDGKKYAEEICESLRLELQKISKKPKLAVILGGENPASEIYVRNKQKKAESIGIESILISLPQDVTQEDILEHIYVLNNESDINAILVQLPLPIGINQEKIIEAIAPQKDCDGFTSYNLGRLTLGYKPYIEPCTPKGIIAIIDKYKIGLEGKNVVVIGRSNIVGKPLSLMLEHRNATVTLAHSYTKDLHAISNKADIVISAIGKPEFIDSKFIKEDAVVIDVGINRTNCGIVGDVKFNECFNKASYITPVPGGIGPMTIAMLMENTLQLYKNQRSL